jgi:hypothetical protein
MINPELAVMQTKIMQTVLDRAVPTEGELLHGKYFIKEEDIDAILSPVRRQFGKLHEDEQPEILLSAVHGFIVGVRAGEPKQSIPYIVIGDYYTIGSCMDPGQVVRQGDDIVFRRGITHEIPDTNPPRYGTGSTEQFTKVRVNENGEVIEFEDHMHAANVRIGKVVENRQQTPSWVFLFIGVHLDGNIHAINMYDSIDE